MKDRPPLKELHLVVPAKIAILEKVSTELLLDTLAPGSASCLKTRADGTILDGHHRVHVLRRRNIDVEALPREVIVKEGSASTEEGQMPGEFYHVNGPWSGKLWIAARPRGGDWLEDEFARWNSQGANAVLSLLTTDEEHELGLEHEVTVARNRGIEFVSLPIPDRGIPFFEGEFAHAIEWLDSALASGQTVVVHCRQGIGRSGMAAACVLVLNGMDPAPAIARVSSARGLPVPETGPQREWIERYVSHVTHAHEK